MSGAAGAGDPAYNQRFGDAKGSFFGFTWFYPNLTHQLNQSEWFQPNLGLALGRTWVWVEPRLGHKDTGSGDRTYSQWVGDAKGSFLVLAEPQPGIGFTGQGYAG